MKVKILENLAGINFSYTQGELVEIGKELAKDLIKAGFAEEVKAIRSKKSGDNE